MTPFIRYPYMWIWNVAFSQNARMLKTASWLLHWYFVLGNDWDSRESRYKKKHEYRIVYLDEGQVCMKMRMMIFVVVSTYDVTTMFSSSFYMVIPFNATWVTAVDLHIKPNLLQIYSQDFEWSRLEGFNQTVVLK